MSAESKKYTEAELKKLDKAALIAIATKEKGLHIVPDETTIPKIVKAILDAQEEEPIPDDPISESPKAPDQPSADSSADPAATEESPANVTGSSEPVQEPTPEAIPEPESKVERITVTSTQKEANENGGFNVAFRERHADHPNGEAWIADNKPHKVAKTRKVSQAILDGKLEEVK